MTRTPLMDITASETKICISSDSCSEFTSPRATAVLLGKYLAAFALYAIMIALTLVYPAIVMYFSRLRGTVPRLSEEVRAEIKRRHDLVVSGEWREETERA